MFALAQFNPKIGDCSANLKEMLRLVGEAKSRGASLVVFPELSTVGYPPRDLLDFHLLVESNLQVLEQLKLAATGIAIVCGYVEPNRSPVGRPFFNSAALLRDGKLELNYRKQLLPYYDVFEEDRYFEPGEDSAFFRLGDFRFALTICEDAWNFSPFLSRLYSRQPLIPIREQRVDWVINLSASPFHLGKPEQRKAVFRNAANFTRAGFVCCNQVGGNDDLLFDGGSFAVNASGETLAQAKSFSPDLLFVDPTSNPAPAQAGRTPLAENEWVEEALIMGLHDYCEKSGVKRVCLGLSGGIDSAVVAALAVSALGKDAVSAIALPSRFTSAASNEDAAAIARALGIDLKVISVDSAFEVFVGSLRQSLGSNPASLTLENLQPRIRMTLLMAIANQENRLLLNTSNKSELATGYSTLYGDSAGGLSVLGDLTKHQVYGLGRALNRRQNAIPERVFTRPPTAELRENQTDQETLPPYDLLDALVKASTENSHGIAELLAAGHEPKFVGKFSQLFAFSEYKRAQFPPILRVSPRAFGRGRRIPLASSKSWQHEH